ncbi:MAG: serine hydrolase [Ignavibacteriales bacterium]|nr:serine hydrolase [Ignavibacteriales bacterium]
MSWFQVSGSRFQAKLWNPRYAPIEPTTIEPMNMTMFFRNLPRRKIIPIILFLFLGLSCAPRPFSGAKDPDWVVKTLQGLTLEEKVAQLVFVWTEGAYIPEDSPAWKNLERLTSERKLGGFIFSIGDVYEYAVQANKLQLLADVPLLLAADFEYGAGMRIRRSTTFPRAMAVGATRNPQYAYEMGKAIAREARAVGIHQNYAPVADVNNNPLNPVINTRAFGDDVQLVTDMVLAFIRGTQEEGVIATVKHFPGHGDTDIDTHLGMPVITLPQERFRSFELPPFQKAFDEGVLSVMISHISAAAFDTAAGIPATVSPAVSSVLLKDEMGFEGLVVTDAMTMRGVSTKYHPAESPVLALKAGMDLILLPPDADLAIDAIVAAVRRGELTEERIDQSVTRALKMKQWLGLDANRFVDVDKVGKVVGSAEHRLLAKEIARKGITVLGNKSGVLPLTRNDGNGLLDLIISDEEDPSNGRLFHSELHRRLGPVASMVLDPRSDSLDYEAATARVRDAEQVVVQMHFYTRSGAMTGFLPEPVKKIMNGLADLRKPMVVVSFGNPYIVMDFPAVDSYVCGYSGAPVVQEAMAEVLFGEEPASGKLPIEIPGVYPFGAGVEYPKVALRTGLSEEAGFDPEKLAKVDGVLLSAIKDSAFPGAQLLVARKGIIALNKSYGSYDYTPYSKRVDNSSLYDLASVTKVIATTSAVMRLLDEGRIRLDDRVTKYIPAFGANGKEHITLYNLLVHNSGLPAWRRFYDFCSTPQCVVDSVYTSGLVYRTGDSTVYSDLGLITMGKIIERVSGTGLDRYVDSVFFKPLGMSKTMYNPPDSLRPLAVPTEVDTHWQKTNAPVKGRVHDENAATLGGVSGHAGLFSNASDLAVFLRMLMNGGAYKGRRYLNEETIRKFTTRQSQSSSRGIGWDMRSEGRSFSGALTSMRTFLHTGFTGTSVVCDPEKDLIVIFLTNRVYPTRDNTKIFRVRPAVHDAVISGLTAN